MKRCFSASNVNDGNNDSFVTTLSKKARKKKAQISSSQPSTAINTNVQSSPSMNIDDIIN